MKGSCTIDGIDIADLGMFILKGGDYDFLSFPERKEPEQNNWHEMDGVEADLSEIYFKEQKVTVRFFIKAENGDQFLNNLNAFYKLISAPGYRTLYSREFDKDFRLRFISVPEYRHRNGMYKDGAKRGEVTVEFSMDDPLLLFTNPTLLEPRLFGTFLGTQNSEPLSTQDRFFLELEENKRLFKRQFVEINGYDLGRFGIIVNQCYNTSLKLPAVKPPLVYKAERTTGLQVSFFKETAFETKQVVVDCTMLATSRSEFYHNYEALFNNLTKKEAVQLSTFSADSACYYSAMKNFEKIKPFANEVRVKFSLVLTILTPGLQKWLLGTENNQFINTQDQFFINI